jgi:hypothetical protein
MNAEPYPRRGFRGLSVAVTAFPREQLAVLPTSFMLRWRERAARAAKLERWCRDKWRSGDDVATSRSSCGRECAVRRFSLGFVRWFDIGVIIDLTKCEEVWPSEMFYPIVIDWGDGGSAELVYESEADRETAYHG